MLAREPSSGCVVPLSATPIAPPVLHAPTFRQMDAELKVGDDGDDVGTLQRLLVDRQLKPRDGKEGAHPVAEKTVAAIKQLQAAAGLPVTGIADAATKAALLHPALSDDDHYAGIPIAKPPGGAPLTRP